MVDVWEPTRNALRDLGNAYQYKNQMARQADRFRVDDERQNKLMGMLEQEFETNQQTNALAQQQAAQKMKKEEILLSAQFADVIMRAPNPEQAYQELTPQLMQVLGKQGPIPPFEQRKQHLTGLADLHNRINQQEGFTLGEGQVRFGSGGKEIARGPEKKEKLTGEAANLEQILGRKPTLEELKDFKAKDGSGTPYSVPVYDDQGRVLAFDTRNRTLSVPPSPFGNEPVRGAQWSPTLKGDIAGAEARGKETGKDEGESITDRKAREAALPRLEAVVEELSALGKKATYTMAGQGIDYVRRQSGLGVGESAVARKEYISKVDNEILPLLRQTFGAQFTQKEGESLKVTLGDPNASPEEKDAVLRSFISTKKAQIEQLDRKIGNGTKTTPPENSAPAQAIDHLRNNPQLKDAFKAKYGYLPEGF